MTSFEPSWPNSTSGNVEFRMEIDSFDNLDSALIHSFLDSELKKQIIAHLTELKAEFIRYFPDIDEKREAWKFIRNPFQCEAADISNEVQEEFLELKFNSSAEEDFKNWISRRSGSRTFLFTLWSHIKLFGFWQCLDQRVLVKLHFPRSLLSRPSTETSWTLKGTCVVLSLAFDHAFRIW